MTTTTPTTLAQSLRDLTAAVRAWRSRRVSVRLLGADGRLTEEVLTIAGDVGAVRVTTSCSPALVRALPGVLARLGPVPPVVLHQMVIDDVRSQQRFRESRGAQVVGRTYLNNSPPVVVIHPDIRPERLADTLAHELIHVQRPGLAEADVASLAHLMSDAHRARYKCWCGQSAPIGRGR